MLILLVEKIIFITIMGVFAIPIFLFAVMHQKITHEDV